MYFYLDAAIIGVKREYVTPIFFKEERFMEKFKLIKAKKIEEKELIEEIRNLSNHDQKTKLELGFASPYIYWDKLKYKASKGLSPEKHWAIIKFARKMRAAETIIRDPHNKCFSWIKLPHYEKILHEMDLHTGGSLIFYSKDIDEKEKLKFLSRGVMEEAIASSQLEGAATSRKQAKEFLRAGRKARNKDEQMILNNYEAMQDIENEYKNQDLDIEMLFELHRKITKNTIEEKEQGVLRKNEDEIVVKGKLDNIVYYEAPALKFVKTELNRLIDFANDKIKTPFIHPVVKAIMLHFWLAYLHPFVDGNGRIARLLFYWYLLKKGYWAFAYLPISAVIKKAPAQYKKAYIYTEQDDNDLTYFIDFNIQKIQLSINNFKGYIERKGLNNQQMNTVARKEFNLSFRQISLLQYFHGNKDGKTNSKMHMNMNKICKKTASTDLKKLKDHGFLISQKQGRNQYYYPTDKIQELF